MPGHIHKKGRIGEFLNIYASSKTQVWCSSVLPCEARHILPWRGLVTLWDSLAVLSLYVNFSIISPEGPDWEFFHSRLCVLMVEAKQLGIPVGNVIVLISSKESLEKTCIFLGIWEHWALQHSSFQQLGCLGLGSCSSNDLRTTAKRRELQTSLQHNLDNYETITSGSDQ